jgi:hypothetical protein
MAKSGRRTPVVPDLDGCPFAASTLHARPHSATEAQLVLTWLGRF